MDVIITLFLFPVLIAICFLAFIYIRAYFDPLRKIPGRPMGHPIFGHFKDFIRQRKCQLLTCMKEDRANYGAVRTSDVFYLKIRLIIGSQHWIKHVLNSKNFQRGEFPGMENLFLAVGDNGLIVCNGEIHKKLRKIASPAFKLSTLKKVMPIIEMCGERMVNLFRIKCQEDLYKDKPAQVDIKEVLNKTTLDVIGLIAFDHDFKESCSFDEDTFGRKLRDWLDQGMVPTLFSVLPFQLPTKRFFLHIAKYAPNFLQNVEPFRVSITTHKIHELVEGIVQTKTDERRTGKRDTNNSKSLLDFILDASDTVEIRHKEMHDILMTFIIAGHETSTLSVTWTLYCLAQNPHYQDRCRNEVRKFFDEHKPPIDWDDLKQLTFLNAVIHESLRLYPPIPWLHRVNITPDEIDGHYIPTNSDILLIMAEMQRNPKHWSNPDEFIPERFLESHETIPWDAFMPFGDGVHKCIGYQLALTETIYFMSVLLKNFEFSIDKATDYRDYVVITLQPKPALKLFVKLLEE